MATRRDVLAGLEGIGTGISKMGEALMTRQHMDAQTALAQEEELRKKAEEARRAQLFPAEQETANANATTAKTAASEALIMADKRKGVDAARAQLDAANAAAGWDKLPPEEQANLAEHKANFNAMNRLFALNGKPSLGVSNYITSVIDDKAKRKTDQEKSAADIGETKARTLLMGSQAKEAEAKAVATKEKPGTQDQANAATFGRRLELAMRDMDEVAKGGYDASSPAAGLGRTLSKAPIIGNFVASDALQRQKNAETNFLTAVLRKESGASISPTEFKSGEDLYFNRAGDSDKTKEQKARNRAQALEGLQAEAGPAWQKVSLMPAGTPAAAAAPGGVGSSFDHLSDDDLDAQLRAKGFDPATGKRLKAGASGSF